MFPVFDNQIAVRERNKLYPSLTTVIEAQFFTIKCPSGALKNIFTIGAKNGM
jgi:hypothetical protein